MCEPAVPARDRHWLDWGGSGPPLHFAHGNGFPPATYRRVIEVLRTGARVVSMEARPLWPDSDPRLLTHWSQLSHDLIEELDRRGMRGSVGVGHSLGAVTSLLAAAEDPGLFRAVVAIDPVILSGWMSIVWGTMKTVGVGDQLPLVKGALKRRRQFPDRDAARAAYRLRRMFRAWDDETLEDYLEAALVPVAGGGVILRYPRSWEARIFRMSPHNVWPQLRRLRVPSLFIRGEHSDSFSSAAARKVLRQVPGSRLVSFEGFGHCVPMECPADVGETILSFLDEAPS
jgi:pimeloyl-ACP methyl ester carboxylesterase